MGRSSTWKSLVRATPGDKAGSIDGLNLFFGALLGANLGTTQSLSLSEYARLVLLLASLVMALRMISTSERRWYVLFAFCLCAIALGGLLFVPMLKPRGLPDDAFHKLVATLVIWLTCVLAVEFSPAQKDPLVPK